ncbi:MAG TPA: RNA methyltransferase [Thermoleophilaceae bacterium]|nr:RNA methyltransferase [Thermoleophilaceae bacterium]
MITSPDNEQLKTIRKLQAKKHRERSGLFVAEGEDLVEAATWEPEILLVAGVDVEPNLLDAVSSLGSGTRVIGVYRQVWSEPGGSLSVYLRGVRDPGNVGAIIRSAHALCDGPVILGPDCADPYSPKAVRASMGSIFARPPARGEPAGTRIALERGAQPLATVEADPPIVVCLGAEREGLPADFACDLRAGIPLRDGGPDSLNVAMAATVALYELGNRMAADA